MKFASLFSVIAVIIASLHCRQAAAEQFTRSWYLMPTGNGYGFQVFDRQQGRITYFLEQPYRYVAPGDNGRTWGIGRRDLAHDIYFGVRINGSSTWLNNLTNVEYEQQTHIIHGTVVQGSARIDSYSFAPFGYAGNGMLMLIQIKNNGSSPLAVSFYTKPNLKLGTGRVDPDDGSEQLLWLGDGAVPHAEETGPGGGHAIYIPIGGFSHASCGADTDLYQRVLSNGVIGDNHTCSGNSQVMILEQDANIESGATAWWGAAVLFVNDNPADPKATLFKDDRTVNDILSLWQEFAQDKDAKMLHDEALTEFETWRANQAPSELNSTEKTLWRQSETVLRMGQVLDRDKKNHGMVLASLPPGEWHTGWVRDATYGVVALSMTGHTQEARLALEFFLGADSGFFGTPNYLDRDYRISVCRYFGNGMEEGDFNNDGPNIETDGWGLVLWAARMYLHYSCDLNWLDQTTWKGDTVFQALLHIAEDIESTVSGNLPGPDASIWEVHWNYRQVFSYTAASQIRGLLDFADIAQAYGQEALSNRFRGLAQDMLTASKSALVHQATQSFASHLGVAGDDIHVDGSAVGFLDWSLVATNDPVYLGTLNEFSKLVTGFGGYRRLEEQLSLTGGGSASTYDLSEWILLDLRIADCWRRYGNGSKADSLLTKITESAAVNDFLVPELYDKDSGTYTGVVPMVGYGAGAWMMSQLEKYGFPAPRFDAGFNHCSACRTNPCTGEHQVCVDDGQGGYSCKCENGYHDESGICVEDTVCDPQTTCAGHGSCTGNGLECECLEGYTGKNCNLCSDGYHEDQGACVPNTTPDGGTDGGADGNSGTDNGSFDDGPASLCSATGGGFLANAWLPLALLLGMLFSLRRTGHTHVH